MHESLSGRDRGLPEAPSLDSELGGPAYRLVQRLGVIKGAGPSIGRCSVCFVAITWLPLLVLATLDGHAIGPTPRMSFLLDFATYARFFLTVPLIFMAEAIVGPRLSSAALRFLDAGLVQPESLPDFYAAMARVVRWRKAVLPEAMIAVFVLFSAWFISLEGITGLESASWHSVWVDQGMQPSLAGLWYQGVAIPLVQFVILRWLWRLVIWTVFLWDVSRLRLDLMPTHTDKAGGLGFLGTAHVTMWIFPFAAGCVLSAEIAFRARFEGLDLASLKAMMPLLVAYIVFVEFVSYGPLLVFVRPLSLARRAALRTYGTLVQQHNQLFHRKWIDGMKLTDELPLGNRDMSSLVDLGSSFLVVRQMNIFPVSRAELVQTAVISCLPALPLAFLVLPLHKVLQLLASIVR